MFPTTPTLTTSPSLMVLPHPYAGHNLFLTHIHPHVTESQLLNFFGKYGPFTSTSYGWVPPSERLQPDVHYESMFWRMCVRFPKLETAEKAQVCFAASQLAVFNGICISFDRGPDSFPPLHPSSVPLYISPAPVTGLRVPTVEEFYEAIRPWGSVRAVFPSPQGNSAWSCRVEFWHEAEVRRFHRDFAKSGGTVNGESVAVYPEREPEYPGRLVKYSPMGLTPSLLYAPLSPFSTQIPLPPLARYAPEHFNRAYSFTGARDKPRAYSNETPRALAIVLDHRANSAPMRPKPLPELFSPSPVMSRPASVWRDKLGTLPTGEYGVLGLEDQYGNVFLHKPGQHYRWMDGKFRSSGQPGLVDYCNLRVKGLPKDVNDVYLRSLMEGGFIRSQVMRDDKMRSKGYGFANFKTTAQAQKVMAAMQGAKCGASTLVITYHEAGTIKPDKPVKIARKPV